MWFLAGLLPPQNSTKLWKGRINQVDPAISVYRGCCMSSINRQKIWPYSAGMGSRLEFESRSMHPPCRYALLCIYSAPAMCKDVRMNGSIS